MKRSRILVYILLILILTTSCVTTKGTSQVTPLNLYSKRKYSAKNQVYFVGEGRANSQRQAELLAYVDLNTKVYRYLGIVEEPESYKELTTSGTISAYNLKIQEKTAYESNGEYIYAIVASADSSLLALDRSPDMQKEEEIAQQAMSLVLEGDECMKENRVVEGLKFYMDSLDYSYGLQYIEDEFSFSEILEEILKVIDVLSISISNENQDSQSCKVTVLRNDTIIPSKVQNSEIRAIFNAVDSRGELFDDTFMYTTDKNGVVDYEPKTYNMTNSGVVRFNFDFDLEIERIEKLSPVSASMIRAAVDEKEVTFIYDKKISVEPFAICVQAMDLYGESTNSDFVADYIVSKYKESKIDTFKFDYIEDESIEELFARFKQKYPNTRDILLLRVGPESFFETQMGIYSMGVEGSVVVYDTNTGTELYNSGYVYANGFGSSSLEAQENAYISFVQNMITLLKAYYV